MLKNELELKSDQIPKIYQDCKILTLKEFLKTIRKGLRKNDFFQFYLRLIPEHNLIYASWDLEIKGESLGIEGKKTIDIYVIAPLEMNLTLFDESCKFSRDKFVDAIHFHSYGDSNQLFTFLDLTKGKELKIKVYSNNSFPLIKDKGLNMETLIFKSGFYEMEFNRIYESDTMARRTTIRHKIPLSPLIEA